MRSSTVLSIIPSFIITSLISDQTCFLPFFSSCSLYCFTSRVFSFWICYCQDIILHSSMFYHCNWSDYLHWLEWQSYHFMIKTFHYFVGVTWQGHIHVAVNTFKKLLFPIVRLVNGHYDPVANSPSLVYGHYDPVAVRHISFPG